jgi:hypothetical protein
MWQEDALSPLARSKHEAEKALLEILVGAKRALG